MKYKWVLFDADETLFHFDAFQGLKLMFSRFEVDFTLADYEHYQKLNKPLWVDYQNGQISAKQLQNRRFESWCQKLKISTQQLNSEFLHAMADICKPLDGAKELIDFLSTKVKLGIITNGFTQLQSIRLERTGFKDVFSTLVISEQVGIAKPDIGIFQHALNTMGNPSKNEVLMVGDNPHSDIQGGINAGIDTCWLNINKQDAPEGIKPTHEVQSLWQLLDKFK
ncbi:noncanonical pyrimidine nucleotidase, YjjG family [Pseudoalteromonas sp. NBT06-2]|uniref:pyrimidine 5'-nucleotidase n=1 Tax=Pseudoalteromonas sp. NBT06-2 TaxID=2025950 RepID=UPI000BA6B4CC|nr:pyrimidine 5'-nucleotidase [Pseudoalteromonas sp. NBT06-2]PAJ74060.1 noncanonical pyrimidine nucleotidase, YjjG family [Pseudoalteromonas sp. NBT06-2]